MMSRSTARTRRTRHRSLVSRVVTRLLVAPARGLRESLSRQTASTPGLLRIQAALALLLTVMVWVAANAIVSSSHRLVTAMSEETAPAILAAGRAQAHLAYADAAQTYYSVRNVQDSDQDPAAVDQPYLFARKMGVKELGQALANNTAGSRSARLLRSAEKGLNGYARLP